jgi:transcriptional regulator with XRE-family HTH domain
MADRNTKTWRTVRGQRPLNEGRVTTYKRLMEAELRLSELRQRRGVSQAEIADALLVSQPNVSRIEQEDDVYFSTLARYVAALGGHLEVLAVFPEETITVLGHTEEAGAPPEDPSDQASPENSDSGR